MSTNENDNEPEPGTDDSEQRRALRVSVDLPARYRSGTLSLDGRANNLSQGGVFFLCGHPRRSRGVEDGPPSGDAVELEIDLPDADRPLTVVGEVRWVEEAGIGIRFTQVPVAERRRLANYVILRAYRTS